MAIIYSKKHSFWQRILWPNFDQQIFFQNILWLIFINQNDSMGHRHGVFEPCMLPIRERSSITSAGFPKFWTPPLICWCNTWTDEGEAFICDREVGVLLPKSEYSIVSRHKIWRSDRKIGFVPRFTYEPRHLYQSVLLPSLKC